MLILILLPLITWICVCGEFMPSREVGFVYNGGKPNALVHVKVFLDLLCPDSAAALPKVLEMADHYGPDKVRLSVVFFPLPYHQNSFYATRAAAAIHKLSNGTKTFDWIKKFLGRDGIYGKFTDKVYHSKSDADLLKEFGNIAKSLGVDETQFLSKVNRNNWDESESITRTFFKYSASRGVYGTPTYMVNGVIQKDIAQSWTIKDWMLKLRPAMMSFEFDGIDELSVTAETVQENERIQEL